MPCLVTRSCFAVCFVLLLLFADVVIGLAISSRHSESDVKLAERQTSTTTGIDTCGFEGNSDIYGLGIRLGIYLQWISSCITFHGRFDSRWPTNLVGVSVIFEIAIFVATLVLVADSGSAVYGVEIMLMTLIFFGDFYFVQVAAVLSYRNFTGMFSLAGLALRLALCFAVLSFSVWFWFPGFDRFLQTPCGSYIFLFAKVPIDGGGGGGGVRKFLRALACIHLLVWAVPLSVPIIPMCGVILMGFLITLIEAEVTGRDGKDGRLGYLAVAASYWQTPMEDMGGEKKEGEAEDEPPLGSDKSRRGRW